MGIQLNPDICATSRHLGHQKIGENIGVCANFDGHLLEKVQFGCLKNSAFLHFDNENFWVQLYLTLVYSNSPHFAVPEIRGPCSLAV